MGPTLNGPFTEVGCFREFEYCYNGKPSGTQIKRSIYGIGRSVGVVGYGGFTVCVYIYVYI